MEIRDKPHFCKATGRPNKPTDGVKIKVKVSAYVLAIIIKYASRDLFIPSGFLGIYEG